LIVPLKRSPHPPEHSARGVMMGLFWAFTPLIGIQMYIVFFVWLMARKFEQFSFNLIIALAWTWVTNIFTMVPTYYVFYITGKFIIDPGNVQLGYAAFLKEWEGVLRNSEGVFGTFIAGSEHLFRRQGVPLLVGSLPFSFGFAWLGYVCTLRFVKRRRLRLALRSRKRLAIRTKKSASR
jgi:uncharacterized protein (DUF2062 family)